jgi:flagellar biosynthesis/type III secretory pathway chaperone
MSPTDSLNPTWQKIAECLRNELAEYGGLLALFAEQQKFLFAREPNEVLRLSAAIEQQVRTLDQCRRQREALVSDFAVANAQLPGATLRSLVPLIDSVARPLIEALIGEINHLLHRVRRTSRHNHTLLARAVEVHQDTLQQLRPQAFTKTYSQAGRISIVSGDPAASTIHVAG